MTETKPASSRRWLLGASVALVILTSFVYFGVWHFDFIDYDDNVYIYLNPPVAGGLTWQTVEWAFTTPVACHWIPITWISLALDCELFGLNAGGHHVTNLLFHATNIILVMLLFHRLTGSLWRSALVAAIFGLHPVRAESVAWVTERKDVLSGFFFLLTLLAYAKYVRKLPAFGLHPPAARGTLPWSSRPYLLALACFALGLMSKPMIVTTPFVLLLLDFWPLNRFTLAQVREQLPALLFEKLPFFGLTIAISLVTFLAQSSAISSISTLPLGLRLANGALAYVNYLGQTFWPFNLSVFYPPYRSNLPVGAVILALLLLLVITLVVLALLRRRPFLAVGWFWFAGMLVPVSGLVMPGEMIQSDHFTYLPSLGVAVMLVWGAGALAEARPGWRLPLGGLGAVAVVALCVISHRQVAVWRDTRTLFTHAAAVTRNNFVAHSTLANFEIEAGRYDAAISNLQAVLTYAPGYPRAEYLMGAALQMQGRMAEAIPHLEAASGPEVQLARNARLILSYLDAGRWQEAGRLLTPILQARPIPPEAAAMGAIFMKAQGRVEEAVRMFRPVTEANLPLQADTPYFCYQLAELHDLLGQPKKTADYYARAVTQFPNYTNALNDFAWLLATAPDDTVRNGARAVELAERACRLTEEKVPLLLGTLAAAYAEAGRFPEAIATTERARDLARALDQHAVALRNAELLELYRSGKPYRESAGERR